MAKRIRAKKIPGKRFHDKIRLLLKNSGFTIIRSDYFRKGADIIVKAEGFKIIVQCRSSEKSRRYTKIDSLIDEYSTKRKKGRAKVAILAFSKYQIPRKYLDEREKILKRDKVAIWDDKVIKYYSVQARALRHFARFPMLRDLGVDEEFGKPLRVPATKIKQTGGISYSFEIVPNELLKLAYVFRRDASAKAYQRMINPARLKGEEGVADFLEREDALLPSNIVCVFRDGFRADRGGRLLRIPRKFGSVLIVDGQHRLYGFCHVNKRKLLEEFHLPCSGFDGRVLPENQQGQMFVDINSKAVRMDKNLLLDLYEMMGVRNLNVELVKQLANTAPFHRKVKLPGTSGSISLATFALTPAMDSLTNPDGSIAKFYGKLPNADDHKRLCFDVLKKYFSLVQKTMGQKWNNSQKYVLSTNRGIRGFLRLLPSILEYSGNIDDKRTLKVLRALKEFDFRSEYLKRKYLGEGGADEFARDMRDSIRLTIPDFAPGAQQSVVDQEVVDVGELSKAEGFLSKWLPKLSKDIMGALAYADPSTFRYLRDDLKSDVTSLKLAVSGIRSDDEGKCRELISEIEGKGTKVEVLKLKSGKEGEEKEYLHTRWIADGHYQIDFGTDLKRSALGNKQHTILVLDRPELSKTVKKLGTEWNDLSTKGSKGFKVETFHKTTWV